MKISPYTIHELWNTYNSPIIDAANKLCALTKDATEDNPVSVGNFRHRGPYSADDHTLFALIMAAIREDISELRREVKRLDKRLDKSAKAKGGAK